MKQILEAPQETHGFRKKKSIHSPLSLSPSLLSNLKAISHHLLWTICSALERPGRLFRGVIPGWKTPLLPCSSRLFLGCACRRQPPWGTVHWLSWNSLDAYRYPCQNRSTQMQLIGFYSCYYDSSFWHLLSRGLLLVVSAQSPILYLTSMMRGGAQGRRPQYTHEAHAFPSEATAVGCHSFASPKLTHTVRHWAKFYI